MGKPRIGNTTKSRRETSHFRAMSERYHQEIEEYKRYAEARRNLRTFPQEVLLDKWREMLDYFEEREAMGKPFTIAGLQMALSISRKTWERWAHGEYDYITEEYLQNHVIDEVEDIDGIPCHNGVAVISWSELAEYGYQRIQNQLEENLYTNRGNPAGSIFSLKHNYKWREDDAPQTLNQTLVIADSEQAKKALSMLTE